MAIFTKRYLEETYKSKYSEYLDHDDDEDNDYDDEEYSKSSNDKNKADKKAPVKYHHLSQSEIRRVLTVVTSIIRNYPNLKKCCDYIDLSYKDHINDDGERESPFGKYYHGDAKDYIQLIDGDVFSGYPDFRSGGNTKYEKDEKDFVKNVNDILKSKGIEAKFSAVSDHDDEAINFGVRSLK